MFIKKVVQALKKLGIDYALVGGYAVSLHGAIRGTIDIDIVVSLDETILNKTEQAMKSLGLVSRLPISAKELTQFREEYINNRNLKAWSFTNPNSPIETVDIIILYDLKEFKTVIKKTIYGDIKLVSIDDLIRIKKEAGRPQDLADIDALGIIKHGNKQ